MTFKYVLAAAVVFGFAGAAVAADASQFVIIKDKSQHCRVVEKKVVSEDGSQYRPQGRVRESIGFEPRRLLPWAAFAFVKTRNGRSPAPRLCLFRC
jgi:hypothetical protein